jgi:hypothetical protein
MARKAVSRETRRRVQERARGRCEYCQHPDDYACAPYVCEHMMQDQNPYASEEVSEEIIHAVRVAEYDSKRAGKLVCIANAIALLALILAQFFWQFFFGRGSGTERWLSRGMLPLIPYTIFALWTLALLFIFRLCRSRRPAYAGRRFP